MDDMEPTNEQVRCFTASHQEGAGIHTELPDCQWPHYIAAPGPAPTVMTEAGPVELAS
jgi:hypothetical protein